jgi:putative oxidoreductase
MSKTQSLTLLAARVLLVLIFIAAGMNKIADYAGTQAYMRSVGVPDLLLPLVIALELGGGLAVLLGVWTRLLSWLLAGFTVLAAVLFHHNFSDQVQAVMFMKNLAIAGGFLSLAAVGSGAYGLDARRDQPVR